MLRSLINVAVMAMTAGVACAQPCAPRLVGAPTGPQGLLVNTLLTYQDEQGPALFAGGDFVFWKETYSTPPLFVGKYQHGAWTPLAGPVASGPVRNLAYADFSSVGGPASSLYALALFGVSRWTGDAWVLVGGLGPTPAVSRGLISLNDSQGPVLLVSKDNTVLAWRGSGSWTPYHGLSVTGSIHTIKLEDDGAGPALFALGDFTHPSLATDIIKLVDGQWTRYSIPHTSGYISDLAVYDDGTGFGREVYITGRFSMFQSPVTHVARLRTGLWEPLVENLFFSSFDHLPRFVNFHDGQRQRLFLGGNFDSGPTGPQSYAGLLEWNGSEWTAPLYVFKLPVDSSPAGAITSMVRFDDGQGERTYISGSMGLVHNTYDTLSASPATGLIRLDPDGAPVSLAQGLGNGAAFDPDLRYDLAAIDLPEGPRLIATGPISRAGGRFAAGAAAFDGQTWTPLNVGQRRSHVTQFPVLAPIDGVPRLVARIITSNSLGYWDGASWNLLPSQPAGQLRKLASFDGHLYAATLSGVHRFDGAAWTPVGGFTSAVTLLVADLGQGNRLYIGGANASGAGVHAWDGASSVLLGTLPAAPPALGVHDAGDGRKLYAAAGDRIYTWNGAAWTPFSTAFVQPNTITFASYDDGLGPALYLSGQLRLTSNATTYAGLYRFRNNAWTPFFQDPVLANAARGMSLAVFQDKLYLAGDFVSPAGLNADHLFVLEPCARTCNADFDHDGDYGTDADIEAFFACLAGNCCPRCTADFNADGDYGTDADIEAFFRVLAGGAC